VAIPEAQLETWSHQGSVTQSAGTYAIVKNALENPNALYAERSFEVFLQGSYGNDTNIFSESDVDIVIRLDSVMRSDVSGLPPAQQAAHRQAYGPAVYTFDEFRQGVLTRLNTAFGTADVEPGNKAIKVRASGSRRSADVVVCDQFRRYTRFVSGTDNNFIPGIIFPTETAGEIKNYPKLHSANCTSKHQATNGWFKPMVRILKNMRSQLVDDGIIAADIAPSYFIEGLLYNVPADRFGNNYGDTFCNCLNWLQEIDRSTLECANEQYMLLGDSNVQWPTAKCDAFLDALVDLWNDW